MSDILTTYSGVYQETSSEAVTPQSSDSRYVQNQKHNVVLHLKYLNFLQFSQFFNVSFLLLKEGKTEGESYVKLNSR